MALSRAPAKKKRRDSSTDPPTAGGTLQAASQAAKGSGHRELVRACHQTHSGGRQMIQEHMQVRRQAEVQLVVLYKAMGLGTGTES